MNPGRFVTFEGIDGAGKSSAIQPLAEWLRERGIDVLTTREPGGCALSERLRSVLLSEPMHLETETLLMFAARREHLASTIEPALAGGRWVLCDRFSDATYGYQVGGRGLPAEKFAQLERWVHPDRQPDLTFLFDLPVSLAQARLQGTGAPPDRFESEQSDFFSRVRNAYLMRAVQAPQRFVRIDASRSPGDVVGDVIAAVEARQW